MARITINDEPSAVIEALVAAFNNHTHSGVTTGAGSSGAIDAADVIKLVV